MSVARGEVPPPRFDHLVAMTTPLGTFEHALGAVPRPEHGFCVDDVARVLLVCAREPEPRTEVRALISVALDFLEASRDPSGACTNRRDVAGRWHGSPSTDDCWGRSVWGYGTAAARLDDPRSRARGFAGFVVAARQRSRWIRATAYAALGAAEVLDGDPDCLPARDLLIDAARRWQPATDSDAAWPWPEPRLTYANATIIEAMLATGSALGIDPLVARGLALLGWLLDRETVDGHLSPTPVGGAGRDDHGPRFDQQPIEVAAMADACVRAARVDRAGRERWRSGLEAAIGWFVGDNDRAAVMWDPHTGGGYDGLTVDGPNRNQGAESTLAFVATMQHARDLAAEQN